MDNNVSTKRNPLVVIVITYAIIAGFLFGLAALAAAFPTLESFVFPVLGTYALVSMVFGWFALKWFSTWILGFFTNNVIVVLFAYIVKLIIAVFLGMFITPYYLGKKIAERI